MSNAATQAYARVAVTTASPREIEAQALLKAANKLQDVVSNPEMDHDKILDALMFNRKLWMIFVGEALDGDNSQQSRDIRQNIANLGIFVLSQTAALRISPQREHFKSLIDINRNIAAGLSGRP